MRVAATGLDCVDCGCQTAAMTRRHTTLHTSIGDLLAVAETLPGSITTDATPHDADPGADPDARADADALIGLYFPGHWHPPAEGTIGTPVPADDDELFARTQSQLTAYLQGDLTTFDLPLRTHGDPLSERIWARLAEIPYGATTTYGALAVELGNRHLAQRVGQAVGHNPISIIIPCHRVVGADGSLTGYAGGLDRKRALLALESPKADEAGRLF